MQYEKLNKRAIFCIFIFELIEIMKNYIILILILYLPLKVFPKIISIILTLLILKDIIYLIICPIIKYERYRYVIGEDSIEIKDGFLFVEINIVPIERIHKITIKKGPIDKLLSLSKVILTTAGGDVTIKFLTDEKVKVISSILNDKINEIAREEKLHGDSSF